MEMQKMKYPIGIIRGDGKKQIAVRFPPKLFNEIIEMAKIDGKDFNATVVGLVTCGKLCLEESDSLEPRQ
jgi:hypothetical protein